MKTSSESGKLSLLIGPSQIPGRTWPIAAARQRTEREQAASKSLIRLSLALVVGHRRQPYRVRREETR